MPKMAVFQLYRGVQHIGRCFMINRRQSIVIRINTVQSTYNKKIIVMLCYVIFIPINHFEYISSLVIMKFGYNEQISCPPKI